MVRFSFYSLSVTSLVLFVLGSIFVFVNFGDWMLLLLSAFFTIISISTFASGALTLATMDGLNAPGFIHLRNIKFFGLSTVNILCISALVFIS